MGCGTWLLTCTCRTCDRIDCHILLQQVQVGRRQQGHLDTSGEAAGISHMLGLCNLLFVDLRQTINIVVTAFDAEILCQVDDLYPFRDGVFLEEGFTLAVTEAEEHDVNLIKRHLVGELQVCLANQSFVHIADQIARVALRVGKDNLCLRMVKQQTDQFSTCITCRT